MDTYDFVRAVLRMTPVIVIPMLMFVLSPLRPLVRYPTVLAVGWVVLFASVVAFWDYSIDYAPSAQIAADLATKDGGPLAFTLFFGWLFVAAYMLALKAGTVALLWLSDRLRQRRTR